MPPGTSAAPGRARPGGAGRAHVLAHLDRGDGVVGAARRVAVILDPYLGQAAEAQPGEALAGITPLRGGQGDRGYPGAAPPGGVHGERAPAASQVEQAAALPEAELAADHAELVALRVGEAVAGVVPCPVRTGIGHGRVEDELVERHGDVVVPGDHRLVPRAAVRPPAMP